MYYLADDQIQSYHECWDEIPGALRPKGWGYVVQDVFGFLLKAPLTIDEEVCYIYEATQVLVDKVTGTGEGITHGQFVYATLASNFQSVTATPTGTIGTDYYFVGVCKRDALPNDARVLIHFWGHEYNFADRAA